MGAYLSAPNLDTVVESGSSGFVSFGAASMQGWRLAQEDAHNCILKLDEETAMFAVYDGHGGSEVAIYTSKHLPDCILSQSAYKEGKLRKCLENAFMEFDARLKEPAVIKEMKQIAGLDKLSESADEEEAEALQEEANLPLNDLLAKYQYEPQKIGTLRKKMDRNDLLSPMVRKKQPTFPNGDLGEEDGILKDKSSESSSSSSPATSNGEHRTEDDESTTSEDSGKKVPRRVKTQKVNANGDSKAHAKQGDSEEVIDETGEGKTKDGGAKHIHFDEDGNAKEKVCNGGAEEVKEQQEKETSKKVEAKESEKENKTIEDDEDEEEEDEEEDLEDEDDEDDDSEDEDVDEEDFEAEDEDEEEDGDEDDDEQPFMPGGENSEPGSDSGCTAVVALLRNRHLVVANAGDSRCVLARGGQALDLSFDHKPEDKLELERIEGAGGRVTPDGRVNGGLNLSRAIGDHCYKCNEDLPPEKQMISAFPDIETTSISEEDQFMVVACDGIWNVFSSQDVVDFVSERIDQEDEEEGPERLCHIVEELFEACLAPDTSGDGTGCDNMTCVIVQFNHKTKQVTVGSKRKTTDDAEAKEESASKRTKADS